jgi:tetratricopeptide (TPR) repeat protein
METFMKKTIALVFSFISISLFGDTIPRWEYSKDQINWQPISIPQNLAELEDDMESDVYFLRHFFTLKNTEPPTPIAMRVGIVLDRERVWLNQKYLGESGDWNSELPQGYDKIKIYNLPTEHLRIDGENEVVFQIKRYFPNEIGIAQDRFEIGSYDRIWKSYYKEEFYRISVLIVYTTVAFYFGFLFLRRRKDKEYLFFALFTINLVLYQFLRTQSKFTIPLEFWEIKKLEYIVLPTFIPLMAHFLRYFIHHQYTAFMKILDGLSALALILVLANDNILVLDQINRFFIQPNWGLYVIHSFYYLSKEVNHNNTDAVLIGLGIISIISSAIVDILGARLVWNIPRISGFVFMANIGFQALLLANRFVRLNEEVEDLNLNLEAKVNERTLELENSYQEIKKLKDSQDGDYFLTSLLLTPLHKNIANQSSIQTNVLTVQKKQFIFKNKPYQIGGDLTLTDSLELNGQSYTVFINSDAMGKSIQGAGGALILGVVIQSILARQESLSQKSKSPEKWLKDAFLDLQKAFETFDGSMFVSLILGLLHTESGFLYFFNAEHPEPILYRNGESWFLENSHPNRVLRKIGIHGNEENFTVSTASLQPNDVMILGTDGRDDIWLDGVGNERKLNEDENLFQKIVNENKADLSLILEGISSKGELSDDISLLRLEYKPVPRTFRPIPDQYYKFLKKGEVFAKREDFRRAVTEWEKAYFLEPTNASLSYLIAKTYYKLENYQLALEYFQKTSEARPEKKDAIYGEAISLRKMGLIKSAIDAAERLRLRDPEDAKILGLIYSLYQKNYVRPSSNWEISLETAA